MCGECCFGRPVQRVNGDKDVVPRNKRERIAQNGRFPWMRWKETHCSPSENIRETMNDVVVGKNPRCWKRRR